jgi:hypothetical protein
MIKAVRGTRDLLPPETALWNFVEAAVRDVFRVAGTRDCHPEQSKGGERSEPACGVEGPLAG